MGVNTGGGGRHFDKFVHNPKKICLGTDRRVIEKEPGFKGVMKRFSSEKEGKKTPKKNDGLKNLSDKFLPTVSVLGGEKKVEKRWNEPTVVQERVKTSKRLD